ncbi:MAG: GNAT family N-acetyltransferase [Phycisphaerae bacterium]
MTELRKLEIRAATRSDFDTVVSFNEAMAAETESKSLDRAAIVSGVRNALDDPSRCMYFVADVEGVVVGQVMVTYEWSDWRDAWFWWIQSVYVAPKVRQRGVFRALYSHVRELARSRSDVCGLRLYVNQHNSRAIETYRKLGMSRTEYLLFEEDWSTSTRS